MVRTPASQSADRRFISLAESYQKTLKNGIHSFPAWRSALKGYCGEQAGKFACCVLGQVIEQDAPSLCGRQVAQFCLQTKGWYQEEHPTVIQMPCNKNADHKASAVKTLIGKNRKTETSRLLYHDTYFILTSLVEFIF